MCVLAVLGNRKVLWQSVQPPYFSLQWSVSSPMSIPSLHDVILTPLVLFNLVEFNVCTFKASDRGGTIQN